MTIALRLAVTMLTLAVAGAASAETPADARRWKEEGNLEMETHRPSDALTAYQRAYELSPEPSLHYNMARALEALGEYPEALAEYQQFERTAPPAVRALVPNLDEVMTEIRSHVTLVSFRCRVPHAHVLVRSVAVGDTDADGNYKQAFSSGRATVEIRAAGYAPARRTVTFEGGARQTVELTLVSADSTAVLAVSTRAGPAEIFVDGASVGRSPVEETVSAGAHEVVARSDGKEQVVAAEVQRGETRHIVVDMDASASTPLTKRWWFWTGVGVAVAGTVAVTSVLLAERSAPSGSIAPGHAMPFVLRY